MVFEKEELEHAVRDIAFDIYHFRLYVKLHRNGKLWACSPTTNQAIIYSLLLHFRILLDFFYKEPTRDDCWVGHFRVLEGFAAAFPPEIHVAPNGAREVSVNLNKRLAHFTATRWREPQPDMAHYEVYFGGIETLIVAFQEALPLDVRQMFTNKVNQWAALHPPTI
jgi:hypothetical protein